MKEFNFDSLPHYIIYQAHFIVDKGMVVKARNHPSLLNTKMSFAEFVDRDIRNGLYIQENSIDVNRFTGTIKDIN